MPSFTRDLARGSALALVACAAMAGAQSQAQTPNAPAAFFSETAPDPAHWYHVFDEQEGGGKIARDVYARIEKAPGPRSDPQRFDTLTTYGPGHWTYEWEQEAKIFLERARKAEQAGDSALAEKSYLSAAHLLAIGSAPHLRSDPAAMAALAQARTAYQAAGRHMAGKFQVLTIPQGAKTFEAYLHLPPGKGPFPVVVASNGSDVVKEQVGDALRRELALHGIALLMIDMPGIGGSGAYDLTPESDALHVAAIDYIRRDPRIDPKRVAGMGISFGGNAAARLFLRPGLGLRGVVEACGPLNGAFNLPPPAYKRLPPFTLDGVRDRLGLPPGAPVAELAARMPGFSVKTATEALTAKIDTPLLILATDADMVAPLDEVSLLADHASHVNVVVSREPGHCPNAPLIAAASAAWLGQRLEP